MLVLKNLTKKFGDFIAVDNLNLSVAGGEIYSFLGPNGSGKTTTIKMITGIYKPTAGQVLIKGYDIEKQPLAAKAVIGYIPDDPFVYEQLTGREFLHFVGTLFNIPEEVRQKKIEQLLKLFPILEVVDGYFGSFSRGTKQKLTILAALLHDPQLLIIDEPMVGLDPQSAHIFKQLLKEFVANGQRAVFVSTHSLEVAQSICSRIGIINHGQLVKEGTLAQLQQELNLKQGSLEEIFLTITN